jgi:hypothetical protein
MNFYTFVANILKGIDLTDCNPIILVKEYFKMLKQNVFYTPISSSRQIFPFLLT